MEFETGSVGQGNDKVGGCGGEVTRSEVMISIGCWAERLLRP